MNQQKKSLTRNGFSLRILGLVRGIDEAGHNAFEVSIEDGRTFYGEWETEWSDDKVHFAIEVIRFGYRSKENISNNSAEAVEIFTIGQEQSIKNLIPMLFNCRELTEKKSPFSLNGAIFNKSVSFRSGWISTSM